MTQYEKVDLAFKFMFEKEQLGEAFTIKQLAEATGWKTETCKTYPSKRWHQFIQKDGIQYSTIGVVFLSKEEFRAIHSQKLRPENELSAKGIHLHKAREFALLAVSTYNNPYTEFKTYGFIVNIIIAFTAMLHAVFEKEGTNYFYLDRNDKPEIVDGEERAWELSECCRKYWKGAQSPESENLRFLIGLRNKIEHRSLPAIDLATSGECQSALNNFETILVEEFGEGHALMTNLAVSMQLTRVSEQSRVEALKQLQTENYRVVKEYMETYRNDLAGEILESQKYRVRAFLVPKLGNHAKSSDLSIEFINVNSLSEDERNNYEQGVAFIKGIESPYKLKPTKVVALVLEKIKNFNVTLHTKCWKYYNARPRELNSSFKGEYAVFVEGFEGYLYSHTWVSFLIGKLSDDTELSKVKRQAI